jgi:hypothetical protein
MIPSIELGEAVVTRFWERLDGLPIDDDGKIDISLGLLFAHPDSETMRLLAARQRYFDTRTGNDWDLFFPGYYSAPEKLHPSDRALETAKGTWWFSARAFDAARREVMAWSEDRWSYSGGADLLLADACIYDAVPFDVEWGSLVGGQLEGRAGRMDLGEAIEAVMADIESGELVRFPGSEAPLRLGRELAKDIFMATLMQILLSLFGID